MPAPQLVLFESTYKWTCNVCDTEVLAIRRNEASQAVSIACPFCLFRMLLEPAIRREQPRKLIAAQLGMGVG